MDADDTSVDLDEQLDCTSEANQPQSRLSAEAIKQSRQELDELLDLSRLAAYAMILDPILFTKEEDLPIANDLLIDRLFPPSFDRKRINSKHIEITTRIAGQRLTTFRNIQKACREYFVARK